MQTPITIKNGQPRLECIHVRSAHGKAVEKIAKINIWMCMPCEGLENAAEIEKSLPR